MFMDAAKGQYLHWLPLLLKVMPVGAVLISDNVLQDGDIDQVCRPAVNRTIHSRMREYLHTLKHMENWRPRYSHWGWRDNQHQDKIVLVLWRRNEKDRIVDTGGKPGCAKTAVICGCRIYWR